MRGLPMVPVLKKRNLEQLSEVASGQGPSESFSEEARTSLNRAEQSQNKRGVIPLPIVIDLNTKPLKQL